MLHQDFLALDLTASRFDGVFANAVLFHVPTQELPRVLGELYAALLHLIKFPHATIDKMVDFIPGPDFPTGGVMMGLDGLREAYEGGRGKVVLRGRYTLERQRDGKTYIIFSEIPYNVVKTELVRQLDANEVWPVGCSLTEFYDGRAEIFDRSA